MVISPRSAPDRLLPSGPRIHRQAGEQTAGRGWRRAVGDRLGIVIAVAAGLLLGAGCAPVGDPSCECWDDLQASEDRCDDQRAAAAAGWQRGCAAGVNGGCTSEENAEAAAARNAEHDRCMDDASRDYQNCAAREGC